MYDLVQTSPPAAAVVTAAEMREHLRLDSTAQDDYLEALVAAATRSIEAEMNRQMITATWAMHLPGFWSGSVEIPRAPLQSVGSITYTDTDGASQTLATSSYTVVTAALVGRVHTAYGVSLPSTRGVPQAVTINFDAGYGDASTDVHTGDIHAVKLLAAHWYGNAEAVTVAGPEPKRVPEALRRLIRGNTARGAL